MTSVTRQLVFESLYAKRAAATKTTAFANLKHNSDLCPMMQNSADLLLRAVNRQRSVAYDVQGPSDAGADVVLILSEANEERYIAFQIKSDIEATPAVYEKIKAQYVDTSTRYRDRLLDYYVLLAWNAEPRIHMIRKVQSDWAGQPAVRVVEPKYLWNFLNMEGRDFDAVLRACLGDADPLVRIASSIARDLTFTQAAVLFSCVVRAVEGRDPYTVDELQRDPHLAARYTLAIGLGMEESFRIAPSISVPDELMRSWASLTEYEAIAQDLERLAEFLKTDDSGSIHIEVDGLQSILALAYEGHARCSFEGRELVEYLENLLLNFGASDNDRRDGISAAVNSLIDGQHSTSEVGLLLEANFDTTRDACQVLFPDEYARDVLDLSPQELDDLSWDWLGQFAHDAVFSFGSLAELAEQVESGAIWIEE